MMMMSRRCAFQDALLPTALVLAAAVLSQFWAAVSGKVLATQMSARVVQTQYGKLRGVLVTLSNRRLTLVESYLGLQYASLLGGELRFMPPTSTTEKWDGIRVALRYRPVCPQLPPPSQASDDQTTQTSPRADHIERLRPFLERQSEECLNLNIYVPAADGTHTICFCIFLFYCVVDCVLCAIFFPDVVHCKSSTFVLPFFIINVLVSNLCIFI